MYNNKHFEIKKIQKNVTKPNTIQLRTTTRLEFPTKSILISPNIYP